MPSLVRDTFYTYKCSKQFGSTCSHTHILTVVSLNYRLCCILKDLVHERLTAGKFTLFLPMTQLPLTWQSKHPLHTHAHTNNLLYTLSLTSLPGSWLNYLKYSTKQLEGFSSITKRQSSYTTRSHCDGLAGNMLPGWWKYLAFTSHCATSGHLGTKLQFQKAAMFPFDYVKGWTWVTNGVLRFQFGRRVLWLIQWRYCCCHSCSGWLLSG